MRAFMGNLLSNRRRAPCFHGAAADVVAIGGAPSRRRRQAGYLYKSPRPTVALMKPSNCLSGGNGSGMVSPFRTAGREPTRSIQVFRFGYSASRMSAIIGNMVVAETHGKYAMSAMVNSSPAKGGLASGGGVSPPEA